MPRKVRAPRDYFDLLDTIHQATVPRTYVEIGVASGRSMSLALPGTLLIGIDPAAKVRHRVSGELHLFRQTSDAFFESGAAASVFQGKPIDVAFIDGLHLSDAVLRDFRNLEAASATNSIILIHDCIPPNSISAARDRTTKIWVGDVWKAILALRHHRPELIVSVFDVPPTGLAMVTGLQPSSRVLYDDYSRIIAELDTIATPPEPVSWKQVVGAKTYDARLISRQLPARTYRNEPADELVTKRSRRRPTFADLTWRMRRSLRHSGLGRFLRSSDLGTWRGRGA